MCMSAPSGAIAYAALPLALRQLAETPARMTTLMAQFGDDASRQRPSAGLFSPLETAWHLRDIEAEGYAPRIRALLTENDPLLLDLDGDALAAARQYNQQALAPALQGFAAARATSLQLLEQITEADLCRAGHYADECVTLGQLITRMLAHDGEHLNDLEHQLHG